MYRYLFWFFCSIIRYCCCLKKKGEKKGLKPLTALHVASSRSILIMTFFSSTFSLFLNWDSSLQRHNLKISCRISLVLCSALHRKAKQCFVMDCFEMPQFLQQFFLDTRKMRARTFYCKLSSVANTTKICNVIYKTCIRWISVFMKADTWQHLLSA